jgi:hypothetical protein
VLARARAVAVQQHRGAAATGRRHLRINCCSEKRTLLNIEANDGLSYQRYGTARFQ